MGKDKKYALLDTDFIYKSHLAKMEICNTQNNSPTFSFSDTNILGTIPHYKKCQF